MADSKTAPLNIDDEENVDWLHKKGPTSFTVSKGGKEVGSIDLTKEDITTKDEQLAEYFYLLMDEGDGDGPLSQYDGEALAASLKRQGYEVKAA
jgi:hypothetical protein